MLQDRLKALMLVSFEKDILLALTNDLHEAILCRDALSMFSSTVQYFTNNGSTVSVAALDMSCSQAVRQAVP